MSDRSPESSPDPYGVVPPYPPAPPPTPVPHQFPGYPQAGYPQPGYPQPGYPPAGYPQPGYAQPGQPYAGHPYAAHPAAYPIAQAPYPYPGPWQGQAPYAPAPKPLQSVAARRIGAGLAGLSVLTIVAAVLPWATSDSQTLLGVSSEVGDGIATIIFAVPCLVLGILRATFKRGSGTSLAAAIVAVVFGALIGLTGIGDLLTPSDFRPDLSRGIGLWLTALVGTAMLTLGIVGIVKRR